MTNKIILIALCISVGCASDKKESATADSTTVVTYTTIATSLDTPTKKSEPEPPIDPAQLDAPVFPMFSDRVYSDDPNENETLNKIIARKDNSEAQRFARIKSTYTKTYQVGNDYDDVMENRTRSETKIWYINANRELHAYTHEMKSGVLGEEPELQQSTIYWFKNQTLVAAYSDYSSGGQSYMETHERIFLPDCPLSCIRITRDGSVSEGPQVEQTDPTHVTYLYTTFQKEYEDVVKDLLNNQNLKTTSDGYTVMVQKPWDDTSYTLTYTIARPLYKKFIKGE